MSLWFFLRFILWGLACSAVVVLCSAAAQGQPRRVTPLHPDTGVFAVAGQMLEGGGRKYGGLHAFADCNQDGLNDWLAVWDRVDTSFQYSGTKYPKELNLYYGSRNGLPRIDSGHRIGPTELGAYTRYLAHGDWNADGNVDLACRIDLFNDTSYGNKTKLMGRLVLFWGNAKGEYSITDTTVLSTGGVMELALSDGGVWDYNNDGIDDLAIRTGSTGNAINKDGNIIQVPLVQIFCGRSAQEWRNSVAPRYADFIWWNPPERELSNTLLDVNCDNYPDLIISQDDPTSGTFAVLYGSNNGEASDTNLIEILPLNMIDGKSAKLIDVTKDNILDLIVLVGRHSTQRIKVYAGEPGKRLSEIALQPSGDSVVWREPWASIPTPNALHDGWGDLGYQLYDLGDANLDGYNDIWAYTAVLSADFLVCYSTNQSFDSLIDGIYRMDGTLPLDFANLGNIDGSGIPVVAMGYVSNSSRGITFFKPTTEIPYTGVFRALPHEVNVQRCFSTVSVASDAGAENSSSTLGLQVIPNPTSGEVRIRWRNGEAEKWGSGEARITVHDVLGQEVTTMRVAGYQGEAMWDGSKTFGGIYFITVVIGDLSQTTEVLLQP